MSTSFTNINPEKIQPITVTVISIAILVLIGYTTVYFPTKYLYIILGLIFICLFASLATFKFEIALFITLFMFPLVPRYLGVDLGSGLPIINVQRILLGTVYLVWIFRKSLTKEKILPKTILDKPLLILVLIQLMPH